MTLLSASTIAGDGAPGASPVADSLRAADAAVAAILAVPEGQRTYQNTLGAVDDLLTRLENDTSLTEFMQQVSTDAAERGRGQQAAEDLANWAVELQTREDLYRAIRAFSDTKPKLEGEQRRLMEHTLRDYRRAGMELPPEQRQRLNEIKKQINKLSLDFAANIRDDESVVPLIADELRGMDADFMATLTQSDGVFQAPLENPTYLPIQEFCEVEATRQKVWIARHRKGGRKNVGVLEQILKLRSQAARMLGYSSNVDFETETRMAKNAAAVKKFYEELRPIVRKKAKLELEEYTQAKRKHTGDAAAELRPWDWSFYESRVRKEKYDVDAKQVQAYFPLQSALDGLFGVTQKLYGIEYREVTAEAAARGWPLWHPDVKLYDVLDQESKTPELLGTFYLDLFPRPNKYSHAAQFGLRSRKRWANGTVQKPLVALVCNFTKPTPEKPSLLMHDEVETLFHEFGHCLHSILTRADTNRFSGTAVARDFVEAPSQMFENWVWDADVLATFARHYQTGAAMPKELLAAMQRSRTFGKGMWTERQLFFGLLDLAYHLDDDGELDTTQVASDLFADVQLYRRVPETWPQASFGHLMGYNSGYYGYMWALVYAADMFQRFQEMGMLSPEAGRFYRDHILGPGGTVDEMELVQQYLGRPPKKEPFLRYLGFED